MVIHWFRRDLRLHDNTALAAAAASGNPVLPLFIFDDEILAELPADDPRVNFIYGQLRLIDEAIKAQGGGLAGIKGDPVKVFEELISKYQITAVYANADYEPYARSRDTAVKKLLEAAGIAFHQFRDHLIFEPGEIIKPDGSPYMVFTPFARKWTTMFDKELVARPRERAVQWAAHSLAFPNLNDIGFTPSPISVPPPDFTGELIEQYANIRDFPASMTSRLGPHLRFGTVSIREAVRNARESATETFLNELIWREFFSHVLWHFPGTVQNSFRPEYDRIRWRNDDAEFALWKQGKTGYPLVDAGMRELNQTGFMHNRVRMVTASFLCKHLLIDWRWGEAYFALKLLDYEQASNVGNWQWVAGSGTDAAPYFRIFNPVEQARKFDGRAAYIRKWIPEYGTSQYPLPMVEHRFARTRCLEAFKRALT